jgi:cytochrome c peroxidase
MFSSLLALASVAVLVQALPQRRQSVTCPGNNQIATNAACCVWFDVREDLLNNVFLNTCQDNVHGNVRLAFHDAAGFSQALLDAGEFPGGGADGSIISFASNEVNTVADDGSNPQLDLAGPVQLSQAIAERHGVGFADVIQFGAALGLTLCPGGPVVPFVTGRPNATAASPPNLVALPDQSVTVLLARMADLGNPGFSAQQVITLLGSHTAAGQNLVDPDFNGSPFDSTPFIWDNQVFLEVLLAPTVGAPATSGGQLQATQVMRLNSDSAFARDSRTACFWQQFVDNHDVLVQQFSEQMFRIGLIGQNENELIDCSEVIPAEAVALTTPTAFIPPGFLPEDVEVSCTDGEPFPTLPVMSGTITLVAPIQNQDTPNIPVQLIPGVPLSQEIDGPIGPD